MNILLKIRKFLNLIIYPFYSGHRCKTCNKPMKYGPPFKVDFDGEILGTWFHTCSCHHNLGE